MGSHEANPWDHDQWSINQLKTQTERPLTIEDHEDMLDILGDVLEDCEVEFDDIAAIVDELIRRGYRIQRTHG